MKNSPLIIFVFGVILSSIWILSGFFSVIENSFAILSGINPVFIHNIINSFITIGYSVIIVIFIFALVFRVIAKKKVFGYWIILIGSLIMLVVVPIVIFFISLGVRC